MADPLAGGPRREAEEAGRLGRLAVGPPPAEEVSQDGSVMAGTLDRLAVEEPAVIQDGPVIVGESGRLAVGPLATRLDGLADRLHGGGPDGDRLEVVEDTETVVGTDTMACCQASVPHGASDHQGD